MRKTLVLCSLLIALLLVGGINQPAYAYPDLSLDDVVSTPWQFGRADGSVIAREIRLLPDGKIQGHSHPNEARWAYENGTIVFYHQDGRPTCRFSDFREEFGAIPIASGKFLLDNSSVHVLRQLVSGTQHDFYHRIEVTIKDISQNSWTFGRGDGSVIAENIRLVESYPGPGGRIDGYHHQNEDSWRWQGGRVTFMNAARPSWPSCSFGELRVEKGRLVMSGDFIQVNPITGQVTKTGITHILRQRI